MKKTMKRVGVYFDEEGLHMLVFNEDGSLLEHHLKPASQVTEEDVARVNSLVNVTFSSEE